MSFRWRAGGLRAADRRRGPRPSLEPLEERGLLSHVAGHLHPAAAAAGDGLTGKQAFIFRRSHIQRPFRLSEKIIGGHVAKVPMVYAGFRGTLTPAIDVAGANGRLIFRRGFKFTGKTVGPIDPTAPAVYTFGVNRGGAAAPGPFPGRPMIYFDSRVVLTTGPGGPSGKVQLLDANGNPTSTTDLPPSAVQVKGDKIEVEFPYKLLPSTSPPRTHNPNRFYWYDFWAGTSASEPREIASFVPEYAITPVANQGFPKAHP